jgi:hypothetical protein
VALKDFSLGELGFKYLIQIDLEECPHVQEEVVLSSFVGSTDGWAFCQGRCDEGQMLWEPVHTCLKSNNFMCGLDSCHGLATDPCV